MPRNRITTEQMLAFLAKRARVTGIGATHTGRKKSYTDWTIDFRDWKKWHPGDDKLVFAAIASAVRSELRKKIA